MKIKEITHTPNKTNMFDYDEYKHGWLTDTICDWIWWIVGIAVLVLIFDKFVF